MIKDRSDQTRKARRPERRTWSCRNCVNSLANSRPLSIILASAEELGQTRSLIQQGPEADVSEVMSVRVIAFVKCFGSVTDPVQGRGLSR
jgi:hypothetical protein